MQLYLNDEISSVTRPWMELKGFRKVRLQPGEKGTVEFTLGFEELSFLDGNLERIVEPGKFRVMIGSSSQHIRQWAEFRVEP